MTPPTAFALGAGGVLVGAIALLGWIRRTSGSSKRTPAKGSTRHRRPNYRGHEVVATGGVALLVPLGLGSLVASVAGGPAVTAGTALWAGSAIAALGYVDDVYGSRHAGGLWGHARELVRGRVTTGSLKAIGGAAVGLLAAWATGWRGAWIPAAGAVVALSANMANLLDLRPGRTIKVWFLGAVLLPLAHVPSGGEHVLVALAGGCTAFVRWELREEVMLGDVGAGLLGAVVGVAAIAAVEELVLLALLGSLLALTITSEVVSFSRVIDATPPLRWLDRLGRHA